MCLGKRKDSTPKETAAGSAKAFSVCALYLALGAAALSQNVMGATEQFRSMVKELVASENYGGCLARLESVNYSVVNCDTWVTMSCGGQYNPKSDGARKYSNAQLAFVMGKAVRGIVDDTRKENGKCYAVDFNVLPFDNP